MKWVGARFGERQSALIEGELASVERASPAAEATQWAQTSSRSPPTSKPREARWRSRSASTSSWPASASAFPAIILIANYIGLRQRRRGRPAARAALVEGGGGALRGRRDHRHGAVVRDGPAVAGVHAPLRRGLRARPSRSRESSSSSRRSSSPSTSSAGSACRPWAHFWTGVPVVLSGLGGALLGGRGQRVDEPAGRLQGRRRRQRHRREPARRASSTRRSATRRRT